MKKAILLLFLSVLTISCNNSKSENNNHPKKEKLQAEINSLKKHTTHNISPIKNQISTFLTFQDNNAENAMNFYTELFDNSKIIDVKRWGKDAPGEEGKIMFAQFTINGNLFMCSDSPPVHDWNFSPAVSNFVECENESEQERLFSKLSENGTVTMPLNNYGFSQKFGWVIDQFGVSWQLNLK
tara:strand:+ start:2709 stop:3257 length:549 start_codon:yes stop_codon:yes gene_type:complete